MFTNNIEKSQVLAKKFLAAILITVLAISLLTGCKTDSDKFCEEFLTEFFSINKDNRYTDLMQKISEITDTKDWDSAYVFEGVMSSSEESLMEYYEPISKYMSEDGVWKLVNMGDMVTTDAACMEKADSWKISKLTAEAVADNSPGYKFSVTLKAEGSKETMSFNGDITIEEKDGEFFVAFMLIDKE